MSIRKIFTIARNEIYTLFYSPIAWVMLGLYTLLTSLDYVGRMDSFLRNFKLGGWYLIDLQYLSGSILASNEYSVFFKVIENMYIFLPLLTMGLISREVSSGTIKLLYSSPLRVREIVLGKYLAIVAFAICMTVIATLLVVGLCFSITNPDIPQLIASVTGLFLIMCCYAAVGLFISSLTSYQIVAAIVTCAVLGFLNQSSLYLQDVNLIRNITFYLNLTHKSVNFLSGLVNLRDFSYFMILIGTFLLLTMVKLKAGTESISRMRLTFRYVTVIGVAALLGYITNRKDVNVYWDTTRGQDFTITKPTQELLKRFNEHEFDVTLYVNIMDSRTMFMTPISQNYIERVVLEQFYRFKPDINLTFVYYYYADSTDYRFQLETNKNKTLEELAENEAIQRRIDFSNVLTLSEVSQRIDVGAEEYGCFFHIGYGDQQMIVRTFKDISLWPSEYEFAAAWQRLVIDPPKIMFLSGELERDPFGKRSYNYRESTGDKASRHSLLNQGFDVDTLSLNNQDVPENIAALVVADPRVPLSKDKIEKIKKYIDQGGNLLLLAEPDSWQNVQPLLEKLGISIKPGMIVQPSDRGNSDIAFPNVTDTARNLSPFFLRAIENEKKYASDTVVTLAMPTVSAMEYKPVDGFRVEPLLVTDGRYSWNRVAPIPKDSLRVKLGKATGDEHGDFVTSVRMYRKVNGKEQRIIVASDADYLSKDGIGRGKYGFHYQLWCYRYFTYGNFPTMTLRPQSIDNAFTIEEDGIFVQRVLFCWILPVLFAIGGLVILIRRKRK